jgi:hypothetical protein
MRSSGISWSFDVTHSEHFDAPSHPSVAVVEPSAAELSQQREWEERHARLTLLQNELDEREARLQTRAQEQDQLLSTRRAQLESDCRDLDQRTATLQTLQEQLRLAEIARDGGFVQERQHQLDERHERQASLEAELSDKRVAAYTQLDTKLAQERDVRLQALERELAQLREQEQQRLDASRERWEAQCEEQRQLLAGQARSLDEREVRLRNEQQLARRQGLEQDARAYALVEERSQLEDEVEACIGERRKSFEAREKQLDAECDRLRAALEGTLEQLAAFEDLKLACDDDPSLLSGRLAQLTNENRRLLQALNDRPGEEVLGRLRSLQDHKETLLKENEQLVQERDALRTGERSRSDLLFQVQSLEAMNVALQRRIEEREAEARQQHEELIRLKGGLLSGEDRDKRIEVIKVPVFKDLALRTGPVNELQWLEEIAKATEQQGLRFSRRILHAFHTCLKTSEWSPLTVLAGASGTGKSQLPKLYAHFGGIHFMSLPVQPTWDSSQSLLGFFNTLDNSFDAQPLLRLLVQMSQPAMKDAMSLVLLDEMNLAHVELYFAEFLSRLEDRRGISAVEVPSISVSLGAKVKAYEVPLGRNVLWAGTMNQDETTKSLSDKVIDRGFMIHFPSPERFERRSELKRLPEAAALLPRATWGTWCAKASPFNELQITPYLELLERINACLSVAGRSMGHRVWQSIEYYMANYPDVRQALTSVHVDPDVLRRSMDMAFEDQLALKVMPKLRGIETRGRSRTECLDVIQALLEDKGFALVDDFRRACAVGYGQFIWSSADYLKSGSDTP